MNFFQGLAHAYYLYDFNARRSDFYRDLAEIYVRSETLLSFLEGEISNAKLTSDKARHHVLRVLLRRLQANDGQGQIGSLLLGLVPNSDRLMLAGVEAAPDKAVAFRSMADAVDHQSEMRKVMLQYSALPAVLIPLCAGLIYVLSLVLVKIDASTPVYVKPHLWTGFDGLARDFATFCMDNGIGIAVAIALAGVAFISAVPRWKGPLRLKADSWPGFGLYRDYRAGLLFSSLAMLLRSGRPLKASLDDLAGQSSGWQRWQLRRAVSSLEENPNDPMAAFARGLLGPKLLGRAYSLKRSSRQLSDVLIEMGSTEAPKVLQRVRQSAILMNFLFVGVIATLATLMGLASITAPSRFSNLMQPAVLMPLKAAYDAQNQKP